MKNCSIIVPTFYQLIKIVACTGSMFTIEFKFNISQGSVQYNVSCHFYYNLLLPRQTLYYNGSLPNTNACLLLNTNQCDLALLLNGKGVEVDLKIAKNLFPLAAEQGLGDAQNNLGHYW